MERTAVAVRSRIGSLSGLDFNAGFIVIGIALFALTVKRVVELAWRLG